MTTERGPVWLVVNGASGSNDDEALQSLQAAFSASGHAVDRVIDLQDDDTPEIGALDAAGVAAVAVFAGDGAINAVLTGLEGWSGDVLVLPGGTTNLLAKSLHGEQEAEAIIAAFAQGGLRRTRRNGIRFGEATALIEILAGPGASWSDVREGMREGDLGQIAESVIDATKQSTGGPMVHITDPDLGREEGYSGVRLTPVGELLEIEGYGIQGVGDFLKQGLALIKRDFRDGPHDDLGQYPAVHCKSEDGSPIELMVDGERSQGSGNIEFRSLTLDLNLLSSLAEQ